MLPTYSWNFDEGIVARLLYKTYTRDYPNIHSQTVKHIYILKFIFKRNTELLHVYFYCPFHYTFFLFEYVFLSFLRQFHELEQTYGIVLFENII